MISARKRRVSVKYSVLKGLSYVCAGLTVAALIAIITFILVRGIAHVNLNFVFGEYKTKTPTVYPALVGTLYLVAMSVAIAAPIGVATAVFLTEYAKKGKLVNVIRVAVETLSSIPSIVYGLFGYIVFVAGGVKWGYTLLGGGITLAIMVLPTILRAAEESLLAVPSVYREGSLALGAGKVRTIFAVMLPNAAGGIVSAVILAMGRVISESAVLILTIGMVVTDVPKGLMSPGTSLALDVYYFGTAGKSEEAAAAGVVLITLVVALNLLASWLGKLLKKGKA